MALRMIDTDAHNLDSVLKTEADESGRLFLLFLADPDPTTGRSWCPDCVRAEPIIYNSLQASGDGVKLLRVYVGDRPTWRNPAHPLRLDPRFQLKGVPTLIRWENSAIAGRLEDHEAHLEGRIKKLLD